MIGPFTGQYRFLSNFHPALVKLDSMAFPTVEHGYQAAKTLSVTERKAIQSAPTAGGAKRLGRKVMLRVDWEDVKVEVMEMLLSQKFARQPFKKLLADTAPEELVELNWWGDTFWGVCRGNGQNWLGKLLMKIRDKQ